MPFQDYFIKVGRYKIPFKYMESGTYKSYKSVIDLNSHTDANGVLHRQALSHVPCKAEFETPPNLTSSDFAELMQNIKANYTIPEERKATVTVFIPEENDYITQDMYMPDITPTISSMLNGEILYKPIRLAFIGY